MVSLIAALSELLDRPVVDRSGVAEAFDFRLTFTPESEAARDVGTAANGSCPALFAAFAETRGMTAPVNCPSIFTAVQEQLGLKLETARDRVEVLVVDRVEKPGAN